MERALVSDLDIYLFDLRGYLVLEDALTAAEVDELNACLDDIPKLAPGEWHGYVAGHSYGDVTSGVNYQQIYEAGEPFEKLIDHPSWYEKVKHFVGGQATFDSHHGRLFIDECFANFREPGEAIGIHSGGHHTVKRNQYRVRNGRFMCGQVNILLALTDIGPGDGGTMLIPGSHKQNFPHPHERDHTMRQGASVDGIDAAIEVYLKKGDAALFVDTLAHGSAKRVNEGTRRVAVYRYGPSWGNFRHGYEASPDLLARLTPERCRVVQPQQLLPREPQVAR